jgi:hypothetical protein
MVGAEKEVEDFTTIDILQWLEGNHFGDDSVQRVDSGWGSAVAES